MIRVARPGGKVAILEFSRPRGRVLGRLYLAFFRQILPKVGQAMLDLLAARGLVETRQHPLTLGIATLYVGVKPPAGAGR